MYTFSKDGKQFQVHIDVFAARRIKQASGLSIETLIQPDHAEKWDRVALFDALLAACQPGKQGVTDEQFALILSDGDTAEAAAEALQKAVIDFLPQRRKSLMHSLMEKQKRMTELQLEAAPAMFDKLMAMQTQVLTDAQSRLSSGDSPASPESTPQT